MRVKIIRQFTAKYRGDTYIGIPGKVMEMPDGAPWVKDGYAIPVPRFERAVRRTPEKAVTVDNGA